MMRELGGWGERLPRKGKMHVILHLLGRVIHEGATRSL